MEPWIELRCVCVTKGGKHPLLGKARGAIDAQIKCRVCGRLITFRFPHPLGILSYENSSCAEPEK